MLDLQKIQPVARKAIAFNSQPTEESFPELPTVLIWIRFLLATAYGCMLGYRSMRSLVMLLHTLNLVAFVPVMYCRMYLRISEDTFPLKIIFSGLFQAVALALLLWIYGFTAANEAHIETLTKLLVNGPVISNTNEADSTGAFSDSEPLVVEDEF